MHLRIDTICIDVLWFLVPVNLKDSYQYQFTNFPRAITNVYDDYYCHFRYLPRTRLGVTDMIDTHLQ